MKDYYKILGITKTANETEIKKAFRIMAIKFHPDKNFEDDYFSKKFIDIKEAYDVLINNKLRSEYDIKYNTTNIQDLNVDNSNRDLNFKQEKKEYSNPYNHYYSSFERESQDTPQHEPLFNPFKMELKDSIFFKLPKKIGKIISGHSTMFKNSKPLTLGGLLLKIIKQSYIILPIILTFCLLLLLKNTLVDSLLTFTILSSIVIGFKLYINSGELNKNYINYFLGINGFAFYKCYTKPDNIVSEFEINFNDVTDLVKRFETRKLNLQYVNTAFEYIWINIKTNKIVYHYSGIIDNRLGQMQTFVDAEYGLNEFAEKYWTIYLLDNLEKTLEEKGFLEFNLYNYQLNKYFTYIRLGVGSITFLNGDEVFTYQFKNIKNIYIKNSNLYIEHINFEKKIFSQNTGNQNVIPLSNLCNYQYFFKALEILVGYKFS